MSASSAALRFPKDFHWGYATASAQVEGSIDQDGRAPSIWDTFSRLPNKTLDGTDTTVTTDTYVQWRGDIELMKSYGVNSHRLSLSWSRIIPLGGKDDPVNQAGIDWYREYLKALVDAGITPFVTLFHWDLPQALEDRYKGFLSRDIVADFERYARVCFESFGDLVRDWFTINEPNVFSMMGYLFGSHAPGRTSNREKSAEGDSQREPFLVGHNLLLSHASAVKSYREEFKQKQGGQIGLVVNMLWGEPLDDSAENLTAADEFMAQSSGWFIEPVVFGDYPPSSRKIFEGHLPKFSAEDSALVKGSCDFLGINHYSTFYIKRRTTPAEPGVPWTILHPAVELGIHDKHGNEIGPVGGVNFVRIVPWGFGKLLDWTWKKYQLPIYITENGAVCPNENDIPFPDVLDDHFRIEYLTKYADQVAMAIQRGVPVKSHLMWALTDNFEWQEGHTARFGVTYIDYEDDCKRYPKKSAAVMKEYYRSRIE
ncbi:glycoside hydrolase superfamily [Filobasidium floriforme]|uniref:glycoside hydrolase superfamily n=1 Tax=Filobasidium floriforme TaxID=5210 RepID=UPI001E8CBC98|nr:glycoside hydrolase superfamily [Filobasidium floriforme]KAH8082758.1 glycoside hydrolase superfamily [Filobasidium floriforme]